MDLVALGHYGQLNVLIAVGQENANARIVRKREGCKRLCAFKNGLLGVCVNTPGNNLSIMAIKE